MSDQFVPLAAVASAPVDSKIWLDGEVQGYVVQARSDHYLVCTKPFNARRTTLYTIIDLEEGVRGTENLIFGLGFETRKQCEDAIERLEGRYAELGFATEVSHRNRAPLRVTKIRAASLSQPKEPQS